MTLQGKGFFAFNLPDCEGGDPSSILAAAQAAGLSHIIVKIADGVQAAGIDPSGVDFTAPVVQALQQAGMNVWGWQSVYGNDPSAEAAIAIAVPRPWLWLIQPMTSGALPPPASQPTVFIKPAARPR